MKMEVFQRPWLSNGPAKVIFVNKICHPNLSPKCVTETQKTENPKPCLTAGKLLIVPCMLHCY